MVTLLSALFLRPSSQGWVPPYETVAKPSGYESAARSLKDGEGKIFLRGDRMTFLGKGAVNPLQIPDWLETKPTRDEGADAWVAQATMKDWDRSFFNYWVKKDGKLVRNLFVGRHAPKLRAAKQLKGKVETIPFESKQLGETRNLMIYVPPDAKPGLKAVYMADGQDCAEFAKVLEPLILAKKVAPTVIIGLFHGEYTGAKGTYDFAKDFRAREYLKVADADRFEIHLRFVVDEVIPWAEGKYGLASGRENRALFGFSNGGAFALVASAERPDVFGSAMPFSVAVFDPDAVKKTLAGKSSVNYYLASGTLEIFLKATKLTEEILKGANAKVERAEYVSGHDQTMWQIAFGDAVPKVFPAVR